MVSSKHFITLDLQKQSTSVIVPLKYGEAGKQIVMSIADGGFPYMISSDCYAVLTAKKPDGNVLYNHCTINENTIIYDVTEQTTAIVGAFPAAINLYGADDGLLISPKFRIIVDGTIYSEGDVLSAPEVSALTHLVSEATTTIATGKQTIQEGVAATEAANAATAAAIGATNSANAAAENANNSATAADASAEKANTASNSANTAAGNAQTAAQSANSAATSANDAAGRTNKAIETANNASVEANEAAKNANEAATKTAQTAKSLMVVGKAEGQTISLDDAIDQFLVGCRIFGKTTQNGTPTPESPVDMVNVGGGGSITVSITGRNDAQSMTIATPNGLPGIPVTSGGNYTDANGQQWICDEIDFARGVYIERVKPLEMDDDNSNIVRKWGEDGGFVISEIGIANVIDCVMCNKLPSHSALGVYRGEQGVNVNNGYDQLVFAINGIATIDELKGWLQSNSITFLFAIATPIETPLSEEEIATYNALRTFRGGTTVSNNDDAYMELDYAMDAKTYIDRMLGVAAMRLAEVNLPASQWTGSDSLYSQVVTLTGITEYSKVDLLPSVEQLAIFYNKDVAFVTEQENGVVTVYAIGDKPTQDYTMQAQITEVAV